MTARSPMPMFPLGSVLLPGALIPLQVFEPRYRDMVRDLLRADDEPEFGQVLITRGREAGGGDERAMVGTVAKMVQIDALDDQRYAFLAAGVRRIVVNEWLPDDPYPIADVSDWPDIEPEGPGLAGVITVCTERVRATIDLAVTVAEREGLADAAVGDGTAAALDRLDTSDVVLASYQLCTVAPIGPADRYRLLAAPGPGERLALLREILDEVEAMLKFRLS